MYQINQKLLIQDILVQYHQLNDLMFDYELLRQCEGSGNLCLNTHGTDLNYPTINASSYHCTCSLPR